MDRRVLTAGQEPAWLRPRLRPGLNQPRFDRSLLLQGTAQQLWRRAAQLAPPEPTSSPVAWRPTWQAERRGLQAPRATPESVPVLVPAGPLLRQVALLPRQQGGRLSSPLGRHA